MVSTVRYPSDNSPERWFDLAEAYRRIAHEIFEAFSDGSDIHRLAVATYLYNHSVELTLKAALKKRGIRIPKRHNLKDLFDRVVSEYSDCGFAFTTRTNEFVNEPSWVPRNQAFRYPEDTSGHAWVGPSSFDLELWISETSKFEVDLANLRSA